MKRMQMKELDNNSNQINKYYHLHELSYLRYCIFRQERDYRTMMNIMGIAAFRTKTNIYAFDLPVNHFHIIIRTAKISEFITYIKRSFSHYCKKNYGFTDPAFKGRCGREVLPTFELIKEKTLYTLRNVDHHGYYFSFLENPWSSSRLYFEHHEVKEGKIFSIIDQKEVKLLLDPKAQSKFLPYGMTLPQNYLMDERGYILPESFIDKSLVEYFFTTKFQLFKTLHFKTNTEIRNLNIKLSKLKVKYNRSNKADKIQIQKYIDKLTNGDVVKHSYDTINAELFKICNEFRYPIMDRRHSDSSPHPAQLKHVIREIRLRLPHVRQTQCSRAMRLPLGEIQKYWYL